MFKIMLASTAVAAGAALFAGSAFAQSASPSSSSATKLSQAQCETLWNQANPSKSATLSMSQAQPYVSDFKSVDTDNDGTISQAEFTKGCNNGHVKGSAAAGSSSGSGDSNQ